MADNRDHLGRFAKKTTTKINRIENLTHHSVCNIFTCTNAAGSNLLDHSYFSQSHVISAEQNDSSFDDINDLLFAGRLQKLGFTRFIVNLDVLRNNMYCHN